MLAACLDPPRLQPPPPTHDMSIAPCPSRGGAQRSLLLLANPLHLLQPEILPSSAGVFFLEGASQMLFLDQF